jgi:competence protein ComEA
MSASPTNLGVATASPPSPQTVEAMQWAPPPVPEPVPVWSRSAQWSAAALLVLAIGLLAYHAALARHSAARPSQLIRSGPPATLDLNQADHAQLVQLPGVGAGLADRILQQREQVGGFRRLEDLRSVPGVGPATLERLRPLVHVAPPAEEEGDEEPGAISSPSPPPPPPPAPVRKTASKAPPGPVNINRASAAELRNLPGIGPTLSQRIVEARAQRPFASVDELRRVRGIGPKTLEKLRPYARISDGPP